MALPARELGWGAVGVVFESEAREFCESAFLGFAGMDLVCRCEGEREVAEGGEVWEQVEGLEDKTGGAAVSDPFVFGDGERFSVEDSGSVGGGQKSGEKAEEGGFSAAGGTNENEGFAWSWGEGEVVEQGVLSGAVGEVPEFNDHIAHGVRGGARGGSLGG